jgi:signal transduction histidine kinase
LKIRYIILLLLLTLSCSKDKKQVYSEKVISDSLAFYMNTVNNDNVLEKEQLLALNNALRLISSSKNSSKNRDTLYNIAYRYYSIKDWNRFNSASYSLIKRSLEAKDSLNLIKIYRYKAGYFKNTQVFDSSFYYYLKGEKLSVEMKDNVNLANILLNKGIVQYAINEYLGAELSLSKAYYIFKETDDKNKIYGTLNQLGLVYNELKEYERAADCHLKALATVKEFNLQSEEHQEAVCYNNLGYLYIKQKDYKKAGENFELGLKDKTILDDDPELYSSLIDNLAYCRMQLNDDNQLPKLFFDALEVRKKLDNYTVVVGSYIHLSEFYQKKKDNLSAIRFSDEALRVARESKIPINIILALKQASVVDDKNSVKYSSDYVRISDSLQIEERNSKDRFARIQLETDELRQENFNLEEKNRNILNYFFGTVVFIGVLFFIRTQRSRARLLALKQAQQQANEEIYRLIISHQNQLELGKDLEKKRLSKELHDGVLGRLFGLRLSLDGLNSFDDEQAKKERLEYLNELQLIEQDLREISHELNRETSLLINNFVAIINSLIEQQAKVNNANIKVVIGKNIDWDKISNIIKINLYRILQEALQNINKHAGAKNVLVHFRKDTEENLLFNIEDDGKGFDTNIKKNKGIGTKNMVSRVHQCNGSIDIKSEIGKGSKIIIIFPLENSNFKV